MIAGKKKTKVQNELFDIIGKDINDHQEDCECFKCKSPADQIRSLFKKIEKLEKRNNDLDLTTNTKVEVVKKLMLEFSDRYKCKSVEKRVRLNKLINNYLNQTTESKGSRPNSQSALKG